MRFSKVQALVATGCVVLTGVAAGCGSQAGEKEALADQSLVFVNWGSDGATAAKAAWIDPFMQETGVEVAMDAPSDPAKVKAMVENGRTTWDVIELDPSTIDTGCGTLFEKLGPEVDMSHVDPAYISSECGVPVVVQSIALVYNKAKFGDNPPTKITDFTATDRFPGRRTMFNFAGGGLDTLLLADGVEPEALYPLDLDRAARVVHGLGEDLVLQSSLAQQVESLVSGDFAMCLCYTGRAGVAAAEGADIGVVWHHMFEAWDAVAAIKGSSNPEAQQALLNFLATPEAQAAYSEQMPYGFTTPASDPNLKPEFQEWLPIGKEDEIGTKALADLEWWGTPENRDAAYQAWTEMTAG